MESNYLLKSKVSHLENVIADSSAGGFSSIPSTTKSNSVIVNTPVNNDSRVILIKASGIATDHHVRKVLKDLVNPEQ